MTWDEFLEWAAFYRRNPWGGERDDLRMEVFRLRFLAAWSKDGEPPRPLFPYFDAPIDVEALKAEVKRLDALLVDDGKGGYRWRSEDPPALPRTP